MGAGLSLVGCITPPPPYVPVQSGDPPPVAHCIDGVPHIAGAEPWVFGGKCCCTPSIQLMQKLHADNKCVDMDATALADKYHESGIQLALDHKRCNNLCEHGPHVVKGGKCMAPPTPGTWNYEEVVSGVVKMRPSTSDYR
jgi:hypothetical protein